MIRISQLWAFVKNPVYLEDENRDFGYRLHIFRRLLLYSLLISITFSIITGLLEQAGFISLGEHAIEALFKNNSLLTIALLAVVAAPIVEELLFRAPLVLFKNSRFFKPFFYLFTLVFGFYHITNFEITYTILLISPLLVAPQISIGFFLGYIRIRFGLLWAIVLHASYNLLLLTPVLLAKSLDLPLE